MAITWSETYATGIKSVDDQHKELFQAVDRLLSACSAGKGKEEVGKIMDFLGEYVVIHFGHEEDLQKKHAYPGYQTHKKLHDEFIAVFGELKNRFEQEGSTLSMVTSINKTVVDWLIKHIGQVDKELGRYLKSHGKL
jgi:hemerythrin